jgi:hypothetical protein
MRLEPNPARTTRCCKLKAVNPPFRSVSTPRWRKDLHVVGLVNPAARHRTPRMCLDLSEWSARRLAGRLQEHLSSDPWQRPSAVATRSGSTVERTLEKGLLEAL